jgi:hypothetical protein
MLLLNHPAILGGRPAKAFLVFVVFLSKERAVPVSLCSFLLGQVIVHLHLLIPLEVVFGLSSGGAFSVVANTICVSGFSKTKDYVFVKWAGPKTKSEG